MNNLHRELAPISTAAWEDLEEEARRGAPSAATWRAGESSMSRSVRVSNCRPWGLGTSNPSIRRCPG